MKNLIIVESPTKAKTISKFIDSSYQIESSFGHVRDLPKSDMGIDIENNFIPKYVVPAKAKKNIAILKELVKKSDQIIMATDEDREGEAIAWHLIEALKLKENKIKRIAFHEITKEAIIEALKNPRELDMHLVDAQQARRILDRLVGYELSPFLWKKVARGLSAGRVQSVAVRLVVEREREVQNFKPQEYWSIEALLNKKGEGGGTIEAKLNKIDGQAIDKFEIKNQDEAKKILAELEGAKYIVADIAKKRVKKNPPKPFTTSTLQQTANRWLGFSAKQTMMLAQRLYEKGFITYMRTDSLNMSQNFLLEAKDYLDKNLGKEYALAEPRIFKTKSKGAQEAHEAIRPTKAGGAPDSLKKELDNNQSRLYKLIWQRAMGSQMPEALLDATSIDIQAKDTKYQFRATGQVIKFDGYLKIYPEKSKEVDLPEVKKDEELDLKKLNKEQHFTQPPGRYSDAGLVKELEKHGIGRPSTYAPTIATIEARNYVDRDEKKKLAPTEIAFVVNDLLVAHFPKIVDFAFTAKLEDDLDNIALGKIKWPGVIESFYKPFHENLENKYNEINKKDIMPEEKSNEKCDKCGANMIIKTGRYGKFLACSAYPDCKNIKGLNGNGQAGGKEKTEEIEKLEKKYQGETCEKCGSPLAIKNGKFGPFLACTAYPKCKNIKNIKENDNSTGVKCPVCGKGEIVQKRSRRGVFYACNQYPDCKTAFWAKPTGDKCPDCKSLLVESKEGVKCSNKGCGYEK
ncbi:DNA topoisomerase I [Candidatus Falkowbacteria bacterium CG11_big_fil_rev_8_21_14_0_20_39_10]|uniref:DNA topoisomerase 1 n=1 Tax=Candidatus Falkowbacteria bacterium CG11_big_fil_rev_8_21_14_0_20_39_10 TaxID=1974570 RepID=A0A2M6K8T8_9BACT|nr:MAG: DNA topoisomerase I [Candidatus Falkowbacteria bacterium CG11_big_fil_rev_8_21_14_0_20_39_10]